MNCFKSVCPSNEKAFLSVILLYFCMSCCETLGQITLSVWGGGSKVDLRSIHLLLFCEMNK